MAADRDALQALTTNEASASVARLADRVLSGAAEARSWTSGRARGAPATDAGVTADKVETPFGDALAVLDRGPEDDAERTLARGLAALAAKEAASAGRALDRVAGDLLWLAVHTPFDATELLDLALPEEGAAGVWTELGEIIGKVSGGTTATLGRAEALVAAAALAGSASATARRVRARLGASAAVASDPVLARLLVPPPGSSASSAGAERFSGEVVGAPRSPAMTVLLAFTGLLFLGWMVRLIGRLALAYRRPAEVVVEDAAIRIRARTVMLGRVLGEREIVIARGGLIRASREVRYPRLAFYAGLLALAVGSYVGVAALVDGTRAASPSLLLAGLVIIAVGIALDVLLGSIAPGVTGTCRVAFVPRSGAPVCVGGVSSDRADAALAQLATL